MYTTSVASKVNKRKFKRTNAAIRNSNRRTPRQRSIKRNKQSTESVLINAFHSKTGQEKSSSFQPKITEQLCPVGEIQTGGLKMEKRSPYQTRTLVFLGALLDSVKMILRCQWRNSKTFNKNATMWQ